jgi:PAS domain S-box-containing protein
MRLNFPRSARFVVMNLFLALAYFLLAKAGLLLALPPGYVTLVFPPAGLAFAACLIWGGRRVALGILLGSFAANATVGGHWHPDLLASLIAAGSTLQALLGAMTLRRVDTQAEFGNARTIGKLIVVVASTCLLAATVGNIALAASGVIHWGQIPQSFVSWWLGDTLGILITMPLVMAFFDSRPLWKRRRMQVGGPLLIAMPLCALVFLAVSADETRRVNNEFSAQADSLLTELRSLGESNSKAVKILAVLTAQEEERTLQQFALNVSSLRQAFPLLQSLGWLPFVRKESLVAFERSQSKQLGIPFAVKPVPGHNFSDSGWLAPVTLIEPMAGNEAALGRDLLSEPVRAQAIEKARATGQVTTTGKVVLVQDRDGPGGLLIIIPVVEKGEVSGVAAGVVNLRSLLQPLMAEKDIRWSLRDLSAATPVHETLTDLPAFTQDRYVDAKGVYIRRTFQVADREWQIVLFKPLTAFKAAPISVVSIVLLMALVTCAGLVLFMLNISAQSERTEKVVDERTKQLREEVERRGASEAELLASRIQLQSILASIPIPLFVKDAQSCFLLMNKACEEQWGMRLEDLYCTDGSTYFPADQMASFLAADRKVFEDGHALDFEEHVWSAALGETRQGHTFKNPVYDANGNPLYLVCATLDVTEVKLAEAGMQQALRDKDALIKEVHHRVKNNLQVITSLLRLEAGRSTVADTKAVLGYMRGRIRTMAQLHESLYRSGTFASVDLGVYLGQVATQAFRTQELHCDSVRLTLSLGSVQAGMDQAQAAGLLLNELISNCLKHGFPEGQTGEVIVEFQPANDQAKPFDGRWCLSVTDTGVGLPPDFEDKRKDSLGLQLVTDLSDQLGGTMVMETVPSSGARFKLVFTVQAPAALVMPP